MFRICLPHFWIVLVQLGSCDFLPT
uniref:Uncharacterized protein n=1 Tax=Anguilla anguilla TaxID=7936 RepID=A0A0E9U9N3_ANGAN